MKKRSLISAPITSEEIRLFAEGYWSERQPTPVHIAWTLENEAVRKGWAVGESLGSEAVLMEAFGVNRNRIREAVRILEARGAMRMQRGRLGGLRLLQPDLERTCRAFSIYLRACGYSNGDASHAEKIVHEVLAELPRTSNFVRLFYRTRELLLKEESENSDVPARSVAIAARLIEQTNVPLPLQGMFVGCESTLSERFIASRATTRQALEILRDVGMLHVKPGRGGGYFLKRPSAIGVVRQVFPLLAADRVSALDTMAAMWVLNLVQLRLAILRLQCVEATTRNSLCAALSSMAQSEPRRWTTLQIRIADIADDVMVSTLQKCLAAYFGRLDPPVVDYEKYERKLRPLEIAIVKAIIGRDSRAAERYQRAAHAHLFRAVAAHA